MNNVEMVPLAISVLRETGCVFMVQAPDGQIHFGPKAIPVSREVKAKIIEPAELRKKHKKHTRQSANYNAVTGYISKLKALKPGETLELLVGAYNASKYRSAVYAAGNMTFGTGAIHTKLSDGESKILVRRT